MARYLEGGRAVVASEGVKPSSHPRTIPFALSPEIIRQQSAGPTTDAIARLPRVKITFLSASEVRLPTQGASTQDTFKQHCIDRVSDRRLRRGRWLAPISPSVEQGPRSEDHPTHLSKDQPATTVPPVLKREASLLRGRWSERRPDLLSLRDKTTQPESSPQRTFDEILHVVHEQIITDSRSAIHTTASGFTVVERKPPEPVQNHTDIPDTLAHIRPSEEWQAAYQFLADRILPVFARTFSVEAPQKQLDAKVAELVQDTVFCLRISPKNLALALQHGRVKSIFETRASTGRMTAHLRERVEYHLFSSPRDMPVEQRVSYGHLTDNFHAQSFDLFRRGSAIIVWKKQVNSRVTFTLGDSGGLGTARTSRGYPLALPVPLDRPNMQALDLSLLMHRNPLIWKSLADVQTYGDGQMYTEGQLHGGNAIREEAKSFIFRNPVELLAHPEVLEQAFKYDIPCFLDFSPRFELERELDHQYETFSKALTAEYGYKIQLVSRRRQYAPLFDELGLQGRRQDMQQMGNTVRVLRE